MWTTTQGYRHEILVINYQLNKPLIRPGYNSDCVNHNHTQCRVIEFKDEGKNTVT